MTQDLRALTQDYIAAFHNRDLEGVGALMDPAFVLTDPDNPALGPREKVLDFIGGLFGSAGENFSFQSRNVLVDGRHSVIEFVLTIGEMRLEGIDLIEWRDGRMMSMRAHLTDRTPARDVG